MDVNNLQGTGFGTPYPAATDIAKEQGKTVFGGVELISDPTNPFYIGHGIGHRDPKTGAMVDPSVHIPARGETHPGEFQAVKMVEEKEATNAQLLESRYGITTPNKYHAGWYRLKSRLSAAAAMATKSQKWFEVAAHQKALADLEANAYNDKYGGYKFSKG